MSDTINKTWFKNRLNKGLLEVKTIQKTSDDYAYDEANNYFQEDVYRPATNKEFDNFYINASRIWGDKNGEMNLVFASCEYHKFRLILC